MAGEEIEMAAKKIYQIDQNRLVTPAKAGVQATYTFLIDVYCWIPAFAGMTESGPLRQILLTGI